MQWTYVKMPRIPSTLLHRFLFIIDAKACGRLQIHNKPSSICRDVLPRFLDLLLNLLLHATKNSSRNGRHAVLYPLNTNSNELLHCFQDRCINLIFLQTEYRVQIIVAIKIRRENFTEQRCFRNVIVRRDRERSAYLIFKERF